MGVATVAWLGHIDYVLFARVNEIARNTGWLHPAAVAFAGYGVVLFAALLVFGFFYARHHEPRRMAAALWAGGGTLLSLALNQPLGHVFERARPYASHSQVMLLVHSTSDFSFPSDHAVMAGGVAAGLWLVSRRLGLLATVAAVLMAATRVYVGAHYPFDVVVGLAVGAAVVLSGWLAFGSLLTRGVSILSAQPLLRTVLTSSPRPAPRSEDAALSGQSR